MNVRAVLKQDFSRDPASRLITLLDTWEPRIARAFLSAVLDLRDELSLDEIIDLINQGSFNTVLPQIEAIAERVAATSGAAYGASAQSTAEFLSRGLNIIVDFDAVNERAVTELRMNRLNLITNFSREQINATRQALIAGTTQGLNPTDQARIFRDSIGLTDNQTQAVANYRRLLTENSSQALDRQLRDRRFDRTVARAIRDGTPLTAAQITRMVQRYSERMLAYRSRVIARTEALAAVNGGNDNMYQQAVDRGQLDPSDIVRQWNTARDSRVRDSHTSMNGQRRGMDEPFVSGFGNQLRYPGDRNAPASETIQCRCVVSTRIERNG